MNIFYTSPDPVEFAEYLDDKRVVKMVLETAQLLSTARCLSGHASTYKPTHRNHPCAVWVRTSAANYAWTYRHFRALLAEYTKRFSKTHACERLLSELRYCKLPEAGFTEPVNCTPHKELSTIEAYKITLAEKWANDKLTPRWYKRP